MAVIWVAGGRPQATRRGQELFERRCTGCHAIESRAETLGRGLADPEKLGPDNNMAFRVESAAERAEIVDYLKRLH
ncbi:MAG: c-type cytochrome [Bryobacteraceae bacterium]